MGEWIEISASSLSRPLSSVSPFMGEWIEILKLRPCPEAKPRSHPSWVSGLKFFTLITSRNVTASHPSWVSGLKDEPDLSFNEVGFLHAFSQPFI